mgnify:CR=1 FL=1
MFIVDVNLWGRISELMSGHSVVEIISILTPFLIGIPPIVIQGVTTYRNLDSGKPLGIRNKIRAYKYFELIDNAEGLDDDNARSAISLKNTLFADVKVDMVRMYLTEMYRQRMDRWQSEMIAFAIGWFAAILCLEYVLSALGEQKTIVISDPKMFYVLMFMVWPVLFVLFFVCYVIVVILRLVRYLCTKFLLKIKKVDQLSLSAVLSHINSGRAYLFIDATVRSGIPSSPVIGNRYDVSMLDCIDEQQLDNLKKFELCQTLSRGSAKKVTSLVKSFLQEKECRGQDLVCFIYSRYGISAIQVTDVLRNYGIDAHYIGKIDGRTKELSRTIKEIELLRACGLK